MAAVDLPTAREALVLQLAVIRGQESEGFFELRPLKPDGQPAVRDRAFVPVRQVDEAIRLIFEQGARLNAYVGAAPRVREDGTAAAVERAWCLWADLDGRDSLERLRDFRPLPTLVIRSGSSDCAHAWWALHTAVTPQGAQRANRRLALALGGDMAATDPARILRPAGSLNHKTQPPAEVTCTRLVLDMFTLRDVVGLLRDTDHYRVRQCPTDERSFSGDPSTVLAGLVRTVADAQEGNRNRALFWSASRVRDHADRGELDRDEALLELRVAAERAGLSEIEIERTTRSAMKSERAAA